MWWNHGRIPSPRVFSILAEMMSSKRLLHGYLKENSETTSSNSFNLSLILPTTKACTTHLRQGVFSQVLQKKPRYSFYRWLMKTAMQVPHYPRSRNLT